MFQIHSLNNSQCLNELVNGKLNEQVESKVLELKVNFQVFTDRSQSVKLAKEGCYLGDVIISGSDIKDCVVSLEHFLIVLKKHNIGIN